jgi:hypothetical protein
MIEEVLAPILVSAVVMILFLIKHLRRRTEDLAEATKLLSVTSIRNYHLCNFKDWVAAQSKSQGFAIGVEIDRELAELDRRLKTLKEEEHGVSLQSSGS